MILAVDFDGVIHNPTDRAPGFRMGRPVPGAVEAMKRLHSQGHRLIVHSVWASGPGADVIAKWLQHFAVPHNGVTNVKPQADAYIDDKAIRFTSWPQTLDTLGECPPPV